MDVRTPGRDVDVELVELFELRYAPLLRLATVVTGDSEQAEDLVIEGFVRLVQHWGRVGAYDAPEAWLRRVVIREAVRTRRLLGRRRSVDPREFDTRAATEVGAHGSVESRLDLLELVRSLPRRERAVVALHYLEDLSVADTAATLGIATGTVKAHLSHARDALRIVANDQQPHQATTTEAT